MIFLSPFVIGKGDSAKLKVRQGTMPSSAVGTFTDPDDYAAAIRGRDAEVILVGRGQFKAKLTKVELHRLWMQRLFDNLPRIARSANLAGRMIVSFRIQPGPSLLAGGLEIPPCGLVRHSDPDDYHQTSSGCASFGAMSLPVGDMVSVGAALAGLDLTPPKDLLMVPSPATEMARLRRLYVAATDLAEKAPEVIANPDTARGLEQTLIEAVVACLSRHEDRRNSAAQGRHAIIMRRFRRVVEENPEEPLYIPVVCKAIGVPSRTLRMVCQEHLGMGPKRYLVLRRLHLARQALRETAPGTTTVTDIATRFGFWQFGRFSVEYQALFGEPPSATLRQQLH
ncbi:MAG: helix-turn-helix domain-containing protein [Alphaproteobacteria bacterium]|nr:helix-turn-helix domain-containing protein [Alphaproteobacteria bacterium]